MAEMPTCRATRPPPSELPAAGAHTGQRARPQASRLMFPYRPLTCSRRSTVAATSKPMRASWICLCTTGFSSRRHPSNRPSVARAAVGRAGLDLLAGQDVVCVDNAVGVALLGQEALAVGGVVLVDRVA